MTVTEYIRPFKATTIPSFLQMSYHLIFNKSNTMSATRGTGHAYPSGVLEFIRIEKYLQPSVLLICERNELFMVKNVDPGFFDKFNLLQSSHGFTY